VRLVSSFAAASLALGGLTAAASPAAAADSVIELPMNHVNDMFVDDARSHLFLTGGGSHGVHVRDLAGGPVAVIDNQPGAAAMAVSSDGSTLYVALFSGDAISAIDTTTLTEVARYATGAATCPRGLAVSGTQLWFGYGCNSGGNIGVVELAGEEPAVTLARAPVGTSFSGAPLVHVSPAEPSRLVAGVQGVSPAKIHLLTIADGALTAVASREVGSNLGDIAITSDGQHVITASGAPYQHPRYKTSDLSSDGVYGTNNPYPTAVAVAPTGHVAAGVNGVYDPDVYVYTAGGQLRRVYEVDCCNASHQRIFPGGLAMTEDATRLFAASDDGYLGQKAYLHIRQDPTLSTSTIALTKPATPKVKTAFSVTGKLAGTVPVPAGTSVQVSRTSKYGTVARPAVTTAADGTFTITDTVSKRGSYTYTASWAGDADHVGATKSLTFSVAGLVPALSITTNATRYPYASTVRLLARLGTTYTNRRVAITATPLDRSTRAVASGTVSSEGYLRATHSPVVRTTYTASFAGDDVYEPRKVTKTVLVQVRITQKVSGYYGASNGYYLYRRSVDPTITATITPPAVYTCVEFLAQRYTSGAWRTVADLACASMTDSGVSTVTLTGDPMPGVPYRVRSRFAGNTYNLPTTSAYTYLKFT